MKVDYNQTKIQSEGIQAEAFFTVKQDNLAHIFSILRNSLYSDKALAIIREYTTNAQDAHVDAGIDDTPIKVVLPTSFNNNLCIRDYGKGLSAEGIFTVFNSYGESTKRSTNSQVGMMGLGSKSAFSYVNDFVIKSYHGGKESTYIAFIDETNIGKVSLVSETETDQTGLEIIIAIKHRDIRAFNDTFVKFLSRFEPKPNVLNCQDFDYYVENNKRSFYIKGDDWGMIRGYRVNNVIRMGNVDYEFSTESLKLTINETMDLKGFQNDRLYLYIDAPIGSVVPSASRESLEMNTKTINYIKNKMYAIKDSIIETVNTKLSSIESHYDFLCELDDLKAFNSAFDVPIVYQGVDYSKRHPKILFSDFDAYKPQLIHRWKKSILESSIDVYPNHKQIAYYYLIKTVTESSIRKRLSHDFEHNNKEARHNQSFLLCFRTQEQLDDFVSNPEYANLKKVNLLDCPMPSVNFVSSSKRKSIVKTELYKLRDAPNVQDSWIPVTDSFDASEGGVYVEIKYFCPQITMPNGTKFSQMNTFRMFENCIKDLGLRTPIYGIRASDVKHLNDKWIPLETYVQNYLDNISESMQKRIYIQMINSTATLNWKTCFDFGLDCIDGDFSRLKYLLETYTMRFSGLECSNAITFLLGQGFKYDMPVKDEISSLMKTLEEKYPILQLVNGKVNSCSGRASEIANQYIMSK